ncbi:MAG: diguanylate cyclase [Kofleriaceae bacterium]
MAERVALFDPAQRLATDLAAAARRVGAELLELAGPNDPAIATARVVLVAPASAAELGAASAATPPRWIVGDLGAAARMAGAAATSGAAGVMIQPVGPDALRAVLADDPSTPDIELARARSLVATSVVEAATQSTLSSLATAFSADDCIIWWRDGARMEPQAAREAPDDGYRQAVGSGARVAAAAGGTVLLPGPAGRSLIAEPLRTGPTEIAGLIAIVSDAGRRFGVGERTDLRALAARVARELSWVAGHRRLVAEGERLAATSLHDPLTQALTRSAFEQAVTSEIAAAARRGEPLAVALVDVVGLRQINLTYGHHAGDEVLAQVAAHVRGGVRGNDPIGRFGGDELCILLGGASGEQAAVVIDKLLERVAAAPVLVDGEAITITLRGAVTAIAPGARSGEAAFVRVAGAVRRAPLGRAMVVPVADQPLDGDGLGDASAMASTVAAGTIVGGTYRVLHELSRGAMGVVYRGEDLGLGRAVAIKVLRSDLASDRELVARFRAEAATLAAIHHENLVQVYSLGEYLGEVYFVMELVEGQPLAEVLRAQNERGEWFPVAAIAQVAMEIADALDAMHTAGVIHRDVKPANILLDRDRDRAVLVDVGVAAKSGVRREAAGTPGFAAPESFLEESDSPETDVYGLGATVYCMLTGTPPFGAGNLAQVVSRQLHEPLVPPSRARPALSEGVDAVLAKALDPTPRKRWSSASTFAIALARALERVGPEKARPRELTQTTAAVRAAEAVLAPTAALTAPPTRPAPLRPGGGVRAAHFRVAAKVISHRLGDAALRDLIARAPSLAAALGPAVAPLEWLELPRLVELLDGVHALAPTGGPRAPEIGRSTVTATFAASSAPIRARSRSGPCSARRRLLGPVPRVEPALRRRRHRARRWPDHHARPRRLAATTSWSPGARPWSSSPAAPTWSSSTGAVPAAATPGVSSRCAGSSWPGTARAPASANSASAPTTTTSAAAVEAAAGGAAAPGACRRAPDRRRRPGQRMRPAGAERGDERGVDVEPAEVRREHGGVGVRVDADHRRHPPRSRSPDRQVAQAGPALQAVADDDGVDVAEPIDHRVGMPAGVVYTS